MVRKIMLVSTIAILMMGGLTACGGQKQTETEKEESVRAENISNVSVNEEYFNWDGTIIESLTELGLKQEKLIIPAQCTGFRGSILYEENNVVMVRFEDEDDVDLNNAFTGASMLKEIALPENLSVIGDMEFNGCPLLKKINIPKGVKTLGWSAFGNCVALEQIDLSTSSLEEIGDSAFTLCNALTDITLPETVKRIGSEAFSKTGLVSVTLPKGIKEIGELAFSGTLKDVYVPESVEMENVDSSAFTQLSEQPVAHVVEGSWADLNFEQWCGTITEKVYD